VRVQYRRLLPLGRPATAEALVAELDLRARGRDDRPGVALNMIASLDGRASLHGHTRDLAGRADYEMFHALRTAGDAILVGAGTVRAEGYGALDRPTVVVSRSLDLPPTLGLLRAEGNHVIVITDADGELEPCAARVEYLRMPAVDLTTALRRLRAEHGFEAIICEGGPHLNSELLASDLIDELHLVLAPLLVGGVAPLTLVEGPPVEPPAPARLTWLLESDGYLFTRYTLDPVRTTPSPS
jgi:riboflavin biosynthesis pyrimidine reductase